MGWVCCVFSCEDIVGSDLGEGRRAYHRNATADQATEGRSFAAMYCVETDGCILNFCDQY